jgi:hypothetical protein
MFDEKNALDRPNGSDHYIHTSRAEVSFERLRIGDGYDIVIGQALPSALVSFKLPPDQSPQYFEFNSTTIETARDVQSAVNLSSKISASVFQVGLDAAATYLQSVTYSDSCMTTVIRVARICPDIKVDVYDTATKPQLTTEAEEVLSIHGPGRFFEEYGQYFVCGHRSQSSLVATLTHRAISSEQLTQFKSKLGAKYHVTSVELAVDLMEKAKSTGITTSVKMYMEGFDGPSSARPLDTLELVSVLNDFLFNRDKHEPMPRVALLEHYSYIDRRLKMSVLQVPSIYDTALMKCLTMEVRCQSSSLRSMRELQGRVISQRRRILSFKGSRGDQGAELGYCMSQLEELEYQVDGFDILASMLKKSQCADWVP